MLFVTDLSAMPATAVSPMHCKSQLDGGHFKTLAKNEYKKLMYV